MSIPAAKAATLKFFDLYALSRMSGRTPRETLDLVSLPTEQALALLATVGTRDAQVKAQAQVNIAMLQAAVSMIPVIGGAAGAVIGAIEDAVMWVVDETAVNCSTGCNHGDERGFVGLWPPPGFVQHGAVPLVNLFHDGLIVAPSEAVVRGVKGGAFARIQDGAPDAENRSRALRLWSKDPLGGDKGTNVGRWARPWEQNGAPYYKRAWRVTSLLQWVQDNVPCGHILCMAALAHEPCGIVRCDYNYMMGSRWAASVYRLQQDVASTVREIGRTRAAALFRELGDVRTAAAVEQWMPRDGMSATELSRHWTATYQPQQLEYNWTPITRHLQFETAKAFLDRALPRPVEVRTIATPRVLAASAAQLSAARDRQNAAPPSTGKAVAAVGAVGLLGLGLFLALR
jgi:hypothetical protein